MFYTVYKITNEVNGKHYIGMHQTSNLEDGYMGSGTRIKAAIKKHGIENFKKEILFVFDNEEAMRDKEKELVVLSEDSYNLCDGGKGGFGYLNRSGKALRTGKKHSEESKKKMGHPRNTFTKGKKLTEEHKAKMAATMSEVFKGVSKSDEHKKRISEAIKKKWQERRGYSSSGKT